LKILVDEQLPPALARWWREQGCDAVHVREGGLLRAPDAVIFKKRKPPLPSLSPRKKIL